MLIGNRSPQNPFSNPGIWTPAGIANAKARLLWPDQAANANRASLGIGVQPAATDSAPTDFGPNAFALTASNAGISYGPFPGSGSIVSNSANGYVSVPYNVALSPRTGNFYLRAWVNLPLTSVGMVLWTNGTNSYGGDELWVTIRASGGKGRLELSSGAASYYDNGWAYTLFPNTWHLIELGRSGSTVYYFTDGVLTGTYACSNDFYANYTFSALARTWAAADAGNRIAGLEFYKGVCLYTATHAIPQLPWSTR